MRVKLERFRRVATGSLSLALCLVLLVACSPAGPTPDATAGSSSVGPLTAAAFPTCASMGSTAADYLSTGNNLGAPELDLQLADARAQILTQPVDAQPGLIRAAADGVIEQCDANTRSQLQAQARASAAASSAAADAAATAAQNAANAATAARYDADCRRVGGTPDHSVCTIQYTDVSGRATTYVVPLWAPADAAVNRADCASQLVDYNQSGNPGWGQKWAQAPIFHATTGVCQAGHP